MQARRLLLRPQHHHHRLSHRSAHRIPAQTISFHQRSHSNNIVDPQHANHIPHPHDQHHHHHHHQQQQQQSHQKQQQQQQQRYDPLAPYDKYTHAPSMPPFELVRDFIQDSLYNPQYGYFNLQEPIIFTRDDIHNHSHSNGESDTMNHHHRRHHDMCRSSNRHEKENDDDEDTFKIKERLLSPLINFNELRDQSDYIQSLKQLYASKNQVWGTPVEVFQPCLAQSILNYMLDRYHHMNANHGDNHGEKYENGTPFIIYEVGGGTGTCALNILATLKYEYPQIYEQTQYHIIEISSELHRIQKSRLLPYFADHVSCHHMSVFDMRDRFHELNHPTTTTTTKTTVDDNGSLSSTTPAHAFIIALEVMDNLPHDKIVQKADGSFTQIGVIQQHTHNQQHNQQQQVMTNDQNESSNTVHNHNVIYREIEMPVMDPVIQRYLHYTRDDLISTTETTAAAATTNHHSTVFVDPSNMVDHRPKSKLKSWASSTTSFMRKHIAALVGQGDEVFFIPTMQMQMVEMLCDLFPSHHMILADFDHLPNRDLNMYSESAIHNQPIVQRKFEKSIKVVNDESFNREFLSASFSTYLVPKGTCDIFFETNFEDLQRVYAHCNWTRAVADGNRDHDNKSTNTGTTTTTSTSTRNRATTTTNTDRTTTGASTVMKMSQFVQRFLPAQDIDRMRTRSGYNPMLKDYANFSFFVSGVIKL